MTHPALAAIVAIVACILTTLAALASRVQALPDVIDLTSVPTAAGLFSLLFMGYGAARRFHPDRVARLSMFGSLFGATIAAVGLFVLLIGQVLS